MPAFTAFDIVVLLLIVLGAVTGALRGFVTEVLSLLAWVAGAVALRLFYKPVAAMATGWVGTESGGAVLAFALVFILTFAIFRAVANNLGHRTRNSVIGPVDRFLGFGFGAAKAVIGASLLYLAITLVLDTAWGAGEPRPEWLRASRSEPLLRVTSHAIIDWVEERRGHRAAGGGYSERARDALGDLMGPAKPAPDAPAKDRSGPRK